ncbi:unnamed protein product [Acanthoscelides obtectus]|uniref:Uncharacterized protein n=1 Tax=Acanthoscelides obtectus TaxID=200917 RepID=A0A9P0Q2U3_ACAOB|nr:unnamed protein product [Acanthoscelides obtectus]CAK1656049.1 hypothetical protein AOBTE_LOCUS19545 [Acanthoscelides obtectus]
MQLAEELAKEHMKGRPEITNVSRNLRQQILVVFDIAERDIVNQIPPILEIKGNKRCSRCPRTEDRKGRDNCVTCKLSAWGPKNSRPVPDQRSDCAHNI